jgi:hypothetical protein
LTVNIDRTNWSGEGVFTQTLLDELAQIREVSFARVEGAPATGSEADCNFISNEVFVSFTESATARRRRRFGFLPYSESTPQKAMTLGGLAARLAAAPAIGEPDYTDEGMLQYLRTERVIPPYQTRGYKLVELLRIYQAGVAP